MQDIERSILERIGAETGHQFQMVGQIPVISRNTNTSIYRVLMEVVGQIEDPAFRWTVLARFTGPGAITFLPALVALLATEQDMDVECVIYQAIGAAVNARNAERIWETLENNAPTVGYSMFAERMLKIHSLRERVVSKLVQHAESGQLSEEVLLGLANSKADEVAETARRILGPHPELRHTVRRKLPRGLWRKVFEPGETAGGPVLIHSFNCDLESAIEDLREQHPLAAETMLSRDVTIDHIASIPEGKMAALPGEPGLVLHRVDITELEVFIYDRVESSKQHSR